jgi:Tol biopolymer transport system component
MRRFAPMVLAAALLGAWGVAAPPEKAPQMLGEDVLSTPLDEFGGAITPDGNTIFFNVSIPRSYLYVICESHRVGGRWAEPEIAPFSGHYRDSDPVLSPDGNRLYFVSDRPAPGKTTHDFDVWAVDRTAMGWGEPRNLGAPVNSGVNEYFASEASDGTLYFTSARKGSLGPIDIYRSRLVDGRYQQPEDLGPVVNGENFATIEVLIAPDQSFLILGAFGRSADPANSDLFVSERRDNAWTAPRALDPINTVAREYSPRFTPDGRSLIFTSERGFSTEARARPVTYDEIVTRSRSVLNGLGNLYEIPLGELGLPEVHLASTATRPVLTAAAEAPRAEAPPVPKGSFAAEVFGEGVISTPGYESGGAFTPDGKEFYFTIRNPTTTTRPVAAICVSRLRGGKWQKPEVAPFSGRYFDYAPAISPDGKWLVFTSIRPIGGAAARNDTDLWIAERRGEGWSEARNLGSPIDTTSEEQSASISAKGDIYFSSDRPGGKGGLDLYRAVRGADGWKTVEPVGFAINSEATETHPYVTPEADLLLFVSVGRPADAIAGGAPYPRGDLYASSWKEGNWTPPVRLPDTINTPASETYPLLSRDRQWLYFTSETSYAIVPVTETLTYRELTRRSGMLLNGGGNIYRIAAKAAGLDLPK